MANTISDKLTLEELDRLTVMHSSTDLHAHATGALGTPRIIERASGIRIQDTAGTELIDAFAGLYCVNVGYGRSEIAEAIYEQAKKLAYYHTYVGHSSKPVIELSKRIIEMAPAGMSRVYYGMSGSDGNETQIKIVWYYHNVLEQPERRKIISRQRGYHGSGIYTGSLTGLGAFQNHFNLPVPDVLHTVCPHYYKHAEPGMTEHEFSQYCADQLEKLILEQGPETIAAFIAEPVLGTGGIIPPPQDYWSLIQPVLKKYDILLIADEVVTAFGRIGYPFGSEMYGIEPDLITVAKGLTSAYVPLSGVIVGEKVWNVLEEGAQKFGPFGHGWTYSAHALGMAAGLANLDIIEREGLVDNAAKVGAYFQERLRSEFAEHPLVGEARGVSMLGALEFMADREARTAFDPSLKIGPRVAAACVQEGVIARAMPHGDILGFAPPLICTRDDIDEILSRAGKGIARVTDELTREGVLPG